MLHLRQVSIFKYIAGIESASSDGSSFVEYNRPRYY
jgi:hypothetical protein